jgi:hypothetical protein
MTYNFFVNLCANRIGSDPRITYGTETVQVRFQENEISRRKDMHMPARGVTQADVAREQGVSRQTTSK